MKVIKIYRECHDFVSRYAIQGGIEVPKNQRLLYGQVSNTYLMGTCFSRLPIGWIVKRSLITKVIKIYRECHDFVSRYRVAMKYPRIKDYFTAKLAIHI
jgi:hypothetical protein